MAFFCLSCAKRHQPLHNNCWRFWRDHCGLDVWNVFVVNNQEHQGDSASKNIAYLSPAKFCNSYSGLRYFLRRRIILKFCTNIFCVMIVVFVFIKSQKGGQLWCFGPIRFPEIWVLWVLLIIWGLLTTLLMVTDTSKPIRRNMLAITNLINIAFHIKISWNSFVSTTN